MLFFLQEEYENAHKLMEEKLGEVEMNLKNTQMLLQEKMSQIKEQVSAKVDLLLSVNGAEIEIEKSLSIACSFKTDSYTNKSILECVTIYTLNYPKVFVFPQSTEHI